MTTHPQLGAEPVSPPGAQRGEQRPDRAAARDRRRRARRRSPAPAQDLRVRRAAAVPRAPARGRAAGVDARRSPTSCAPATSTRCRGSRAARARAVGRRAAGGGRRPRLAHAACNRILEVDLENQRVVCQPGVTNIAISAAVGPTFFYPPDPSSQIVCSIGGNVAENSGGAHCFKYGFTTNYVLRPGGRPARRDDRAPRRQGARPARLRRARRVRRLGGHARRRDRDHRAHHPVARGGAHARRVLRHHRARRRGRLGDRHGRGRPGRRSR